MEAALAADCVPDYRCNFDYHRDNWLADTDCAGFSADYHRPATVFLFSSAIRDVYAKASAEIRPVYNEEDKKKPQSIVSCYYKVLRILPA
jgi:hypothetical protein